MSILHHGWNHISSWGLKTEEPFEAGRQTCGHGNATLTELVLRTPSSGQRKLTENLRGSWCAVCLVSGEAELGEQTTQVTSE